MEDMERRLATVEAGLSSLLRIEGKLDQVLELSTVVRHVKERQEEQNGGLRRAFRHMETQDQRFSELDRTVESRNSYMKGMVAAATIFWATLQGVVGYVIVDTVDMVRKDHETIIRIEEAHDKILGWQTDTLLKN